MALFGNRHGEPSIYISRTSVSHDLQAIVNKKFILAAEDGIEPSTLGL